MKIKVYLNDGEGHYFGYEAETAHLRLAAEFDMPYYGDSVAMLNKIYEQLNVGGDLVPATDWCDEYRAKGKRSLSVGDVVVVGEQAFAVASLGFDKITLKEES